jgi:serine/threonine protein phosphatase PrpC
LRAQAPLTIAVRTDTGLVRTNNEDAYGSSWMDDGSLFVIVADGMGGHAAGEVASRLAVDVVDQQVRAEPTGDPRARLYHAIIEANEAIIREGKRSGRRGMGTTAITAIVREGEAFLGQVGDSRLFHVRRGNVVWRTLDHTRVQSLLDRGIINDEEARSHPDAGMLTRALGHAKTSSGAPLEPDVMQDPLQLQEGDALVLSSDGMHDLVEDWEVATTVAGGTADDAAEALVRLALQRGGHDNVTVIVVVVGDRAAPYERAPEDEDAAVPPTVDVAGIDLSGGVPPVEREGAAVAGSGYGVPPQVLHAPAGGVAMPVAGWIAPADGEQPDEYDGGEAHSMWWLAAAAFALMGVALFMLLIAMAMAFG